jgi:outer membrane protein OmpU
MKKILLTSSALVLVGGTAFAEVTLSGSAEMGVVGGKIEGSAPVTTTTTTSVVDTTGTPSTTTPVTTTTSTSTSLVNVDEDTDLQFWSDMDVTFTLSGETGNGVSFGASIDLDDATENGGIGATSDYDFAVFVSGDWGTVTLGDTDGAFDWAMQDTNFGMPGTINDAEEHLGYDGMNILDGFYDGQIARYDYSFGDFAFAVSAEVDDNPDDTVASGATDFDDPMFGVGAKYSLDLASSSWTFGAAYQGTHDVYVAGLSAAGSIGGFSLGLAYYAGEVADLHRSQRRWHQHRVRNQLGRCNQQQPRGHFVLRRFAGLHLGCLLGRCERRCI